MNLNDKQCEWDLMDSFFSVWLDVIFSLKITCGCRASLYIIKLSVICRDLLINQLILLINIC